MDTVYGTKKYFQSLGTTDNDYYNNRNTSNRVMVSALLPSLSSHHLMIVFSILSVAATTHYSLH